MTLTLTDRETRILFEVPLRPIQGSRFQPTGFPDLGPAAYQAGGVACLLVESAQSMANRLEQTIWDDAANRPVADADGVSYVRVLDSDGNYITSSITESHRLNSPYILEGKDKGFANRLREEFSVMEQGPIDRAKLARTLLKFDVNSLLHGVFLAKKELAGGRLRVARAISSFIEAESVVVAASGGVKNDHVDPQGDTAKGFGNVPFHREEFTAEKITAYFNIDVAQIRGYGLGEDVEQLLVTLALYKIRRLLDGNLRLRTACDLELAADATVVARRPEAFELPSFETLASDLRESISRCGNEMETTTVTYTK